MNDRVLIRELLGAYGEFRSFLRHGPPAHLAFEILRDADGRASMLRAPLEHKDAVAHLLAEARSALGRSSSEGFDASDMQRLATRSIGENVELSALLLRQDADIQFALWRRELMGRSWNWSLDAVFVPLPHAGRLIELSEDTLSRAPSYGG